MFKIFIAQNICKKLIDQISKSNKNNFLNSIDSLKEKKLKNFLN